MNRAAAASTLLLAALLAGCARDAEPAVFAVPGIAAVGIRMTCPPGPTGGDGAPVCPPPLPRAARPQ